MSICAVILAARKSSVQDVKVITEKLKSKQLSEWEMHREVYRPWGKCDSVDMGDR